MIKKLPKLFIILILSFILLPIYHTAAADFSFEYDISHTVTSDLQLISEYNVTVTNNVGNNYISKTELSYPYKPDTVEASNDKGNLVTSTEQAKDGSYNLYFDQKPILGSGIKFKYKVKVTSHPAEKTGGITEISVPGFSQDDGIKVNKTELKLSKNIQNIKYISKTLTQSDTDKKNSTGEYNSYTLSSNTSLNIVIAEKTKYKFNLTIVPFEEFIYMPIDNSKQSVTLNADSMAPNNTLLDDEGNVALSFDPLQSPIKINGELVIQTDRYSENKTSKVINLDNTFWKYDKRLDDIVAKVSKEISFSDKVKATLSYIAQNKKFNNKLTNNKRLDTHEILDTNDEVSALNISDLTITILRSAGVDAKLIGGFVDTQLQDNFQYKGLHFWIEYYDSTLEQWKSADPALQILAPNDNYYDGVGLSHISIYETRSGWNIPIKSQYEISATPENGELSPKVDSEVNAITSKIESGKDKFITVSVHNTGNKLIYVDNIATELKDVKNSTEPISIKKYIFPNQKSDVELKIKNNNYYEERSIPILVDINTNLGMIQKEINVTFERANNIVIIAVGVGVLILVILGIAVRVARKKR